jgi:5-hydroxyisourate hydrolase-like protein (transthyretin family)
MSSISTHVLDTSSGKPVAGVRVHLFGDAGEIASGVTNADGRCPALLPQGSSLCPGTYHLSFEIADYFSGSRRIGALSRPFAYQSFWIHHLPRQLIDALPEL